MAAQSSPLPFHAIPSTLALSNNAIMPLLVVKSGRLGGFERLPTNAERKQLSASESLS
jgi:hypothetical protein